MTDGFFEAPHPVEDVEALRVLEEAQRALAEATRRLVDGCVRTRLDAGRLLEVGRSVDRLAGTLLEDAHPGPLGLQVSSDGLLRDHGSPGVGMRNPVAPPLVLQKETSPPTARTTFEIGAAYEGPPGHAHGGVIALVLDQVLGVVPALRGKPGLTAYLNVTYRRPTPLGRLGCEAWVAEAGEWRTLVKGHLLDADGRVTAEAEGLFVVPRMAREAGAWPLSDAGEFMAPGHEPG